MVFAAERCIQADLARFHLWPGFLDRDLQAQRLLWRDAHDQPVRGWPFDVGAAKEVLGRLLETDCHHGARLCHALAGAQIERHVAPSPVVDVQAQRRIGLRHAVGGDAGFLEVSGHAHAIDVAARVLCPVCLRIHRRRVDRADRFEHLDLLVAQFVCVHGHRWLHRDQRHQLHQVALQHVAQRARAFVEAGSPADTEGLGAGDLYMVDVVAVPQGFEHQVRETRYQHVLHHGLAHVVIDTVGLVFAQVTTDLALQVLCALEAGAEGLLDHDAPPGPVFMQHAMLVQRLDDTAIGGRWQRDIEHVVVGEPGFAQQGGKALKGVGFGDVTLVVVHAAAKRVAVWRLQGVARTLGEGLAHMLEPSFLAEFCAAGAHDADPG